jgi:hypothetical protein
MTDNMSTRYSKPLGPTWIPSSMIFGTSKPGY